MTFSDFILFGKRKNQKIFADYFSNIATERSFLPFFLRALMTFLPSAVLILFLKPWVLFLEILLGWYVLFITFSLKNDLNQKTAILYS